MPKFSQIIWGATRCLFISCLLISCVPKTTESDVMINPVQETTHCSLELDFADDFQQTGRSVSDNEASYQVILRDPFQNLVSAARDQLEANGWQFQGSEKAARTATTHLSSYTCQEKEQSLQLSIKPRGKSLIYDIKLMLE